MKTSGGGTKAKCRVGGGGGGSSAILCAAAWPFCWLRRRTAGGEHRPSSESEAGSSGSQVLK